MIQLVQVHARRPAFTRRTFDEALVGYDGAALRFGSGAMIGRCSLDVAWRFLNEVSLYANHELPALLAACVEGERRDMTPGQIRALAALFLED